MSVRVRDRKPSQFEVFHHLTKMRKEITDLLLRDFGYSFEKAESRLIKRFGGRPYEELTEVEQKNYDRLKARWEAFDEWFIQDERKAVIDAIRSIVREVYIANSIYPTCVDELIERRIHQDEAVGHCYDLTQELQYAIETLPVDVNIYLHFGELIQTEINLIKGWRKSDNKFRKGFEEQQGNL